MKESKYVKAKIATGYVLLLAVCLAAVGSVYRAAVQSGEGDGTYALLRSKRDVAAKTLYHLYQAEGYGQLMTAGYRSYEERYRNELRTVRGYLDSLRGLERDSLQMQRLDSISMLIADKERRTVNLLRSLRSGGTAGLLTKNIEQLIRPQDTLSERLPPVIEKYDTLRVQKQRRGFLRRIADVFSPPKEDSSVVISATRLVSDSLPASVVADTIASVLRGLQDRVTGERIEIYDKAWNEGLRLSYSNQLVNRKIYRLLSEFQREDDAYLLRRIEATEFMRRRSSGTLGWIAGGAVVLMLLFVAVLWRDINRSNRYKRELEQANCEKQALLEAREKLMLAITHDIKAPLGAVMGYIDLLSRLCTDKRQAFYLRNMQGASEHLLGLVNSLLDFHRLDRNKVEAASVAFDPARLFESVRTAFALAAEKKGITLRLDLDPTAHCEVSGDPSRLRQIADNLVSNALKFTDEGSVTISAHLTGERLLVFSVKDTGRGISREEQERIFREFVRLRSAEGVDGFGLGLSIVDRLVKLLGGRIWLESVPGAGSKFIVSVPVAAAPPQAEAAPADGASGIRVLLVDDDPLQLEMTAALCRAGGVEPVCCQYPEYAAKLAAEHDFDAVLTDIQMPAMDGFQVLAALRKTAPGLPVIAVSARSEEFPDGFSGVLRKPFAAKELLELLAGVCAKANAGANRPAEGAESDPEASGSGLDALTAFAGDDTEAARGILLSFVAQNREACDQLEAASAAGDVETVKALAHRMAPVFVMMGDAGTAAALRQLERHEGPVDGPMRILISETVENVRKIVEKAQNKLSLQSV